MRGKKSEKLKYLIYVSKPTVFDHETILDILSISRVNNSRTGLTGCLIYRFDFYGQFLEGPPDAVIETYNKIKLDTRHSEIRQILEDTSNRRLFASWAMREEALHTALWPHEKARAGLMTRIKPSEAFDAFKRLSREVDQFVHTGESK